MSFMAVYPSHAVARWIDAEVFERERERELASTPLDAAPGSSDPEHTRLYSFSRATRLRYRPFERLLSLLSADARSLARRRAAQR